MEFIHSSQSNDKENIPPFSSKHPSSVPLAACPSKTVVVVSKRTRRPLEDITNRFHPDPTLISASGFSSLPLHMLRRRTNCQSDVLASPLSHGANLRKRRIMDDQSAPQRSCRMSLRKGLR